MNVTVQSNKSNNSTGRCRSSSMIKLLGYMKMAKLCVFFLHDCWLQKPLYTNKDEALHMWALILQSTREGGAVGGTCVGKCSQSQENFLQQLVLVRRRCPATSRTICTRLLLLLWACWHFLGACAALVLHLLWAWQHVADCAELALLLLLLPAAVRQRRDATWGWGDRGGDAQTLSVSPKVQVWRHHAGASRGILWKRNNVSLQVRFMT